MGLSLVSWPPEVAATALLVLALGLVLARARRHARLTFARTVMWAVVATSAVALAVHATGLVPLDIPRWFYAVALLPFLGPAAVVVGGRALRPVPRTVGLLCLPLGLLAAVLVVNDHYQYWPTVGAMLGQDHADPLLDEATALRLAAAGAVPTPGPVPDDGQGRLVDLDIPGTSSGFHARQARLWLPPGFLSDPSRPRPVIEMIGGTPSWTSDWTRSARLDRAADAVADAHDGEAPLIVMVDANGTAFGDTECVGRSEDYLVTDVPAFLEARFSVPADRSAWAVAGYSEGGTCAVTLALRHPDTYSAFADLAGDAHPDVGGHHHTVHSLFGGSEAEFTAHDPSALLATGSYPGLAGWFGAGHGDGSPRRATAALADAARAAGVDVTQFSCSGGHDFGFVTRALDQALPWLDDRLHVPAPSPTTDEAAAVS